MLQKQRRYNVKVTVQLYIEHVVGTISHHYTFHQVPLHCHMPHHQLLMVWPIVREMSQGGEEYPTYNTKEEGHILRMNCLLKDVIEVKMEGRLDY